GNDTLKSYEGEDTLIGGTGNDTLSGGSGKDTFIFAAGDGRDTITDFDARAGELVDVRGYSGYTSLISESGGTRMVFEGGDSILFQGVAKSALTGVNFTFNGVSPKNLADVGPVFAPAPTPPASSDEYDLSLYKLSQKSTPDSWLISEWDAGQTNNMSWSANNVSVAANGDVSLSLTKAPAGSSRPYLGAEVQSNEIATTGTWSWTAQAPVMAPGAVFGMFTYKADWKNDPWVEFDFEFVGGDTTKVQLAIHMENAKGEHMVLTPEAQKRSIIDLGFDASKGMHTYEVSVTEKDATFYIDGKQVAKFGPADMQGNVWQIGPMASFFDLWSVSSGQEAWAGKWTDPGRPLVAIIEGADIRPAEFGSAIEVVSPPVVLIPDPIVIPNGINGDDSANTLNGTSGNDKIYGLGGNDIIDGKAGADEMYGGTGNDVYWVDNAGDRVIEKAGEGRDEVHSIIDWTLGENIEDLHLRTPVNTKGTGNALDNLITANAGRNVLSGMAGNDTLKSYEGEDTLIGGTGNDTLSGGSGKDTFIFAAGDGRDTITDFDARAGEILDIRGYANVTALISENGGTRIVLGTNDSIFLQGVDKAILTTANFLFNGAVPKDLNGTPPTVRPAPLPTPIPPAADINEIRGSNADDTMRGTTQSDIVWGLEGLDTFYWQPGVGNDTYHGGTGTERYDANPYTPGNPGGDRLILDGSAGLRIDMHSTDSGSVQSRNDRLEFTGIERIFGTTGDDVVVATNATVNSSGGSVPAHGLSIFTGAGNDRISGSQFDDVIDGGSGNDTINGDGGNDFIHSSTGNDLIYGGAGDENIRWGNGDANHNPGNDTIDGGSGNDLINIWIKRGDIYSNNDTVGIEGVSVTVDRVLSDGAFSGNASTSIGGTATLRFDNFELGWTHAGNDVIDASGAVISSSGAGVNFNTRWGHDRLVGSRGNDTLDGSMGRDTVQGGQGDDRIWIGDGHNGDGASDVLIFRAGDGADIVYGFESSRDTLDLGGRSYSATEVRDGTLLNFGSGDSVLLNGVFDFI
ncbi:family 16 glycosylhydrolase, partial [Paracoccus sp. NFXS7]|uniref:family 16 glycosylhydrolase n=1 Tax=Paracoccus sp. NFXS7 TaxID=2908653 RepID=UPI0032DE5F6F